MKYFAFIFVIICVSSCSRDKQLDSYYQIVDSADKLRYYVRNDNAFTLTRETESPEELKSQKYILKRNIEFDLQRNFIPSFKIEIYKKGKLLGTLFINTSKEYPYVNFQNENFGFGFKLTHGIGMSL